MRTLSRFCLLICGYSVLELYNRYLQNLLSLFVMEFASFVKVLNQTDSLGCGFLVFGCFSQVFNLFFLFFLFLLGLKFLHFRGFPLSVQLSWDVKGKMDRFSRKIESFDVFNGKKRDCDDGFVKKSLVVDGFDREIVISHLKNDSADGKNRKTKSFIRESRNEDVAALQETEIIENDDTEENENENGDSADEDQIFDVITLRKMVKKERKRGDRLYIELEKERVAAASAAEEAMLMLLRLQSEKSAVEMEANQYRRIAEQKQMYDQEVIQGLQWMVMKHEEERKVLEDRLRLCVRKLKAKAGRDGDSGIDAFFESLLDTSGVNGEMDEGNVLVLPEMDSEDF